MEENKMKRKIIALLLVVIMVLSLAACGRKKVVTVALGGVGDYELVKIPEGLENLSTVENVIKMTIKKDGDYTFVVRTDDGQDISFVVSYAKGSVSVSTDAAVDVIAGIE